MAHHKLAQIQKKVPYLDLASYQILGLNISLGNPTKYRVIGISE